MRYIVLSLFILFSLSSCLTQKRAVYNYLEDIKDTSFKKNVFIAEAVIQKNDLLSIQISSISLNPDVDKDYNLQVQQGAAQNTQLMGYLVDVYGNIDLPRIGSVHAEGLTKSELEQLIRSKVKDVLKQPSIMIRFLNFRITVLGEVGSPGVLT
ncbi:MAG: polysaccharide export protein, partial [Flaviaesturariibacter sp.]|nr:polysaccharide export protein [Flaviaesturariibacter sp.]